VRKNEQGLAEKLDKCNNLDENIQNTREKHKKNTVCATKHLIFVNVNEYLSQVGTNI